MTRPLSWENGCLSVSLDRINNSSSSLFLPDTGLEISGSVNEVADGTGKKSKREWLNFYGATDIVSWGATAIAPGGIVHGEYCLSPKMPVVNLKGQTRREIALRGTLRVDAYYFLTEGDWKKSKAEHEQMLRTPPQQWKTIKLETPQVVTIFTRIPCQMACSAGCDNPPPIVVGENRIVPDVRGPHDWNIRGKTVDDELARKFPACPDVSSSPH
ncbi:MAG TPA: hypothetical protein VKB26_09740 [Candidatus Acidoferrales bacterium]|nr:hypothetical protein [Candidatus Acidoferrales bacterium]